MGRFSAGPHHFSGSARPFQQYARGRFQPYFIRARAFKFHRKPRHAAHG
jgi:hypothetical protein